MKNKKLTYFLIPLVLLVWGMIIYRIFNAANNNTTINRNENRVFETKPIATISDTFSLMMNYKDPFLNNKMKRSQLQETTSKPTTAIEAKKVKQFESATKSTTSWPTIVFNGLIKNQKSNKQLALLQINGQADMMQIGDIKSEIKLLKAAHDSIEISFNSEHKIIKK